MGLTGTWSLVRLALRRDRIMIPVTLATLFVLVYTSVIATIDLYPDEAARILAARVSNASLAVVAMYGHIYDETSMGSLGSIKLTMMSFIIVAILVIAIVRRHTRGDEEAGRFELVRSTVVGRRAPLATAVLVATVTSVLAGVLCALGSGLGGFDWPGSWAFGCAVCGAGLSWTAVTAVAAQLSPSNRVCGAFAFGSLGVAFLLRMFGDLNRDKPAEFLAWLSPLGWSQQVRPFGGDRWWVLAIPAVFFVAGLVVADRLHAARDHGAGLLPEREGRDRTRLGSAMGLAWRLQRGAFVGWAIGFALLGLILGTLIDSVGAFITGEAADLLRALGGVGSMENLYLTLMASMMALVASCYGVASGLRLVSEEGDERAEPLLATPITRLGYMASHGLIALTGAALLPLLMGLGLAASHAVTSGKTDIFGRDLGALAVQIPAVLVVTAVTLLVFGWAPRWAATVSWGVVGACAVVGEFGQLLSVPEWVQGISPFWHVPKIPAQGFDAVPMIVLVAVAAGLCTLAYVGFRRRDVVST